ncbi:MAG: hypothetical protein LBL74_02880 [Bacteroidales bacterium]|jgi:hypothetical protein|nr:hypothetical protein [Bacteroidales bacterium]
MFIRIFKKHYFPQLLIIGITPIILWAVAFIKPPAVVVTEFDMPIYTNLYSVVKDFPLLATSLAFVAMILNGLFLNYIFTSNKLTQRTTYMPAFIYYLLVSSNYQFMTLSSVFFMNLFLTFALWSFFRVYNKKDSLEEIFTTALIISLGSMLFAPTSFFLLWIWIGFSIYKTYSLKKWLVSLFGFITPFIFAIVYYYLTDQVVEKMQWFVNTIFTLPHIYPINKPIHVVYFAALLSLLVPSMLYVRTSKQGNNIIYGKKCNIITLLLIISFLPMSYLMAFSEFSYCYSVSLSFILTIFFFAKRKILYSNIILMLLIVLTALKIYYTFP